MKSPLILLLVLVLSALPAYMAYAEQPARVGNRQTLSEHLAVRQRADTLQELLVKAKPRFVWGSEGTDMLWIIHDEAGRPGFAMNRAYPLNLDRGGKGFYLLEATAGYISDANVDYTRSICRNPRVLGRHPELGVVYDCPWPSPVYDGTGHIEETRHVLLLCDGKHRWHLLGEGPEEGHGKSGIAMYWTTRVTFSVRWTANPASPVEIGFTSIDTIESPGADSNAAHDDTLEMRQDAILEGPFPAKPRELGLAYTLAGERETLTGVARRVAHWYLTTSDEEDSVREGRKLQIVRQILAQRNPHLAEDLPAGRRVIIGDTRTIQEAVLQEVGPMSSTKPTSRR